MINFIYKHRFLISRRVTQITLLFLYFGANAWGWSILDGNLSSSKIVGIIPMSDPFAVLQMIVAGAVIAVDIIIGALIVLGIYMIVGGRVFCSWVCPVNIITDMASYLRRKLKIDNVEKPYKMSRRVRFWAIAITLILSSIMGLSAFEFISPVSMVHRGIIFGLGFGWATIMIIFLFDLFILKNGWCGHVCPLGGFYSLVGKYSLVRVDHNEEQCTLCMECKVVCPEIQVLHMIGKSSEQVLSGDCTNCGRCIEVCNDDALNFSIRNLVKEKK
jgi:ferredoxin-type protein NapH